MMLNWSTALIVVLGFILPTARCGSSPGHLEISSKHSGQDCGDSSCVSDATCQEHNTCVCNHLQDGSGELKCYPPNSWRVEIDGQTNQLNTKHFTGQVLWPGSYGLTYFTCTRKSNHQHCRAQIIGISTIRNGKTVIYGFRLNFRCDNDHDLKAKGVCLLVTGYKKNGIYYYRQWGIADCGPDSFNTGLNSDRSDDLTLDGSGSGDGDDGSTTGSNDGDEDSYTDDWDDPVDFDLGGGHVVRITIDDDNTAVVSVPDCSFEVGFRAYDSEADEHEQGGSVLYVYADDTVDFLRQDEYYAGAGSDSDWDLDPDDLLLNKALTNYTKQLPDELGRLCTATAHVYQTSCGTDEDKQRAVSSCSFLLSPDAVHCVDGFHETESKTNSLLAFQLCLKLQCGSSDSSCDHLKSVLPSQCWHVLKDGLSSFDCQ